MNPNKRIRNISRHLLIAAALLAGISFAPRSFAQEKKSSTGESFFIVASVDQQKSQLLLKRPTEVTLLVRVDDKTRYTDDTGKPIKLTDLRAGDTIWVTTSGGAQAAATSIRKGQMTLAELHHDYLDYPEIK